MLLSTKMASVNYTAPSYFCSLYVFERIVKSLVRIFFLWWKNILLELPLPRFNKTNFRHYRWHLRGWKSGFMFRNFAWLHTNRWDHLWRLSLSLELTCIICFFSRWNRNQKTYKLSPRLWLRAPAWSGARELTTFFVTV
jgi:hypothetical protein